MGSTLPPSSAAMKPMSAWLASILSLAAFPCAAEWTGAVFDGTVTHVVTRDGPSETEGRLPVGHRIAFFLEYQTVLPEDAPQEIVIGPTGYHWMIGEWSMADDAGLGVSVGLGTLALTNDHPRWDAIRYTGDPTQVFGRYGDSMLMGASLVLTDPGRTALASTDLAPMPALSAFASGEFAFVFADIFAATTGPWPSTLVLGRIDVAGHPPTGTAFTCEGFGGAAALSGRRPLMLRASLRDAGGAPLLIDGDALRPIVRVLKVWGGLSFIELDGVEPAFIRHGPQWQLQLPASAFPDPGTYFVYLASPDTDRYVVAPDCLVELTVAAR
jgi:hypothetical protein